MNEFENVSEYKWWAKKIHSNAVKVFGSRVREDGTLVRIEKSLAMIESPDEATIFLLETIVLLRDQYKELFDRVKYLESMKPTPDPIKVKEEDEGRFVF
jgi:hypothetical protein